jgi:hypothetical protein
LDGTDVLGERVIVRLTGGLGNQMFMYAFGRALSLRRQEPVQFHWARSTWDYALDKYNVNVELVDPKPVDRMYTEASFGFDGNALGQPSNTYLSGYWQSEQYLEDYSYREDYSDIIRKELTLKNAPSPLTVGFSNELAKEESVFIHIRRGDYILPGTSEFHGNLGMDYYNRAIEYVREKVQNPKFYVFSDDPDYGRALFPYFDIASFCGSSQHDDLYLMSRCKHGIGANSSFSWWGAWLGEDHPGRVCVFPEKWFVNEAINTQDLIPDRWVKI